MSSWVRGHTMQKVCEGIYAKGQKNTASGSPRRSWKELLGRGTFGKPSAIATHPSLSGRQWMEWLMDVWMMLVVTKNRAESQILDLDLSRGYKHNSNLMLVHLCTRCLNKSPLPSILNKSEEGGNMSFSEYIKYRLNSIALVFHQIAFSLSLSLSSLFSPRLCSLGSWGVGVCGPCSNTVTINLTVKASLKSAIIHLGCSWCVQQF